MVADAAGYVKAKAGWATVLLGIRRGGVCWQMLLQAYVSVYVMCVRIYPLGQCQEPRVNRGVSK